MDIFLQQILNGLVLGSIYALIALGYTMVYGIMGLINFAHGEVVMFGAMVTISIIGMLTGMGLSLPGPVVVLLALMLAIPVCMLMGFAIERIYVKDLSLENPGGQRSGRELAQSRQGNRSEAIAEWATPSVWDR